jgi:hypothetical protein
MKVKNKKRLKNLIGMLFNLSGGYLLFTPSPYPYWHYKLVGIIGLFYSYGIFHSEVKK